jgi:flagellar basal-body rod protein FlgB
MIESMFSDTTLPALEQVAKFSERRHEVLAGNVANINTPGYRGRDLSVDDFRRSLAEAIELQEQGGAATPRQMLGYAPGQVGVNDPATLDPYAGTKHAMETLVYHDGSDLNMERQVTELSKNQAFHRMAISLMRSQFNTLNAAISERV